MSVEDTVLHIADVHKSFGGLHALSDIDLSVQKGTTHAIIGPNGAGKSTLLNVCIGRLIPDRGAVPILSKKDGSYKFNPMQNLAHRKDARDQAMELIEDVGLHPDDHAGSLSRGDKRRLELAMCLSQHPKLLLLDEPTAGMSRHDTNSTIELLKKIKERGMTKVVIEHDMHVVFSLADKISVLAEGKIIAEGTPEEVKANPVVQEAYLGG